MGTEKQESVTECLHKIEWDSSLYPVDESFDKFMIGGTCTECNEYFERYFTCDMFVQVNTENNETVGHWLNDFEVKKEDWED